MAGTFLGINMALGALQAQQAALNTVSNNIANANTPGYKRQRVVLGEGNPLSGPFIPGIDRRLILGSGVHVAEIQRVQDEFVDSRVRTTSAMAAEWGAKSDILSQIESVFNEPGEQGIANQLNKFWAAWDKLAAQPDDIPTRKALIEQAQSLTQQIRTTYTHIRSVGYDIDVALRDKVARINSLTTQIADLNSKITWANSSSAIPNDLLDQRDLLVGELTSLAGVEVSGKGGQDYVVTLGNKVLVQGIHADQLGVRTDLGGIQEVYSVSTGEARRIPSGEIAGLMEMRGNTIPDFLAQIDDFVANLAPTINTIHRTGFTLGGAPAGDFFDPLTTAANFEIAADMLASPANIATSGSGAVGDNSIALQIAGLRTESFGGQTLSQMYQTIVSDIGTRTALAGHYAETQNLTLEQFIAQQQSVSGVSLDEEMTDMVKFQQAYNAAARVLTTCDEMLSVLIERTGVVGR